MATSHSPEQNAIQPAVCDYEGSTYRTDFWTSDRTYEDAVERIALKALLPSRGQRLIEIGAGFGRLVELYAGYDQVVLFDYSRSMLRQARARWGDAGPSGRPRYRYVAADMYALPFVNGLFDAVTMIRVIHHAQNVPQVLQNINDVISPRGTFVLEFANKRHLKAILRWLIRKQDWNPFALSPIEFVKLNFDFHPQWMQDRLKEAGFKTKTQRTVSHLRVGFLKRLAPIHWLVKLDSLAQPTGRWWQLTPSVFVKSRPALAKPPAKDGTFFCCPVCRNIDLRKQDSSMICQGCRRRWPFVDGIYDFKEPL